MDQMFARFPALWPGPGYLLTRIALAATAIPVVHESGGFIAWSPHGIQNYVAIGVALMLVLGLLTPIAALLLAGALIWRGCHDPGFCASCCLLGVMSLGLALTGPGGWSLDAMFFGRRRIEVPLRDRE